MSRIERSRCDCLHSRWLSEIMIFIQRDGAFIQVSAFSNCVALRHMNAFSLNFTALDLV